jgi:hypothetical protein
MTNCNLKPIHFSPLSGKKILADFSGGSITSNAGALLLREADKTLQLTNQLSKRLLDRRQSGKVDYSLRTLLCQRIYALACGYEDVNDHQTLRHDALLQTAVGVSEMLASSSTVSRMENGFTREDAVAANLLLVELFIQRHKKAPKELILDFDATDNVLHGNQEQKHFHGYYDHHCYLPLYVFCGNDLLVSYLRPSNIDGAKHAWAILALLVRRLRQVWPEVEIIFRGDSGFCRDKMLLWCDRHDVGYIVGMASNNRLAEAITSDVAQAKQRYFNTQQPQRQFERFEYAAATWKVKRLMIARIEYNQHGESVRFVATNLSRHKKTLYDILYCQRGDMENKIKQQKLDLFSERTSCHAFIANQMRILFSGFAYVLIEAIKRLALKNTKLKHAYAATIREHCLKIGAVVIRNTRKVKVLIDSHYPWQDLFIKASNKLVGS